MEKPKTHQRQVNIRLDDDTLAQIDDCRTQLRGSLPNIPSRSDVVRMAIEEFLRKRHKREK